MPKQLLYGQIKGAKRPPNKPKLRFKDCLKNSIVGFQIPLRSWEQEASDRVGWRTLVHKGAHHYEASRIHHANIKRAARKREFIDENIPQFICDICERVCLSNAGLTSHKRSHTLRPRIDYDAFIETDFSCSVCNKVCKSRSGLTRHQKTHDTLPNTTNHSRKDVFTCTLCHKVCRSLAGLKSHCRTHAS